MAYIGAIVLALYAPSIAALNYDRFTQDVEYLSTWETAEGLEHALDQSTSQCADDLRQLHAVANDTWESNDTSIWTEKERQDLLRSYASGPYAPFG